MLSFLNKYAKNYFASQNGEEGCLIEICQRLDLKQGHAIETGGANGLFCSNTALLLKDHGWSGLFIEYDYNLYLQCKQNWQHNPQVRSQCSRVDERNINAFVDDSCDLLSLDTDGSDYKIFQGLKAKPKIVIVEIDSSIEPPSEQFNSDGGASYWTMVVAGLEKSYFLLCHTGNLIFIDQQYAPLFPECKPHPLLEWELYFNRGWVKGGAA